MPVFIADGKTPRHKLQPKLLRCHLSQGHVKTIETRLDASSLLGIHRSVEKGVPIPPEAIPDVEEDAHMIVVDVEARLAYDFWQCRREPDGSYSTNSAIVYDLDGSGVFAPEDIAGIRNDESVHFYGPCRASGVPALAGLIMRGEMESGHIKHKLAFACGVAGLQRYIPPAIWTDGWLPGGLPEGCILQLNPELDVASLNLCPAAAIIARALQEYGAILVDNAGSVTLYGELLDPHPGRTWRGVLEEDDLFPIDWRHFRVLETGSPREGGSHPIYHHSMSAHYYDYIRRHGTQSLNKVEPWRQRFP
jgi:hypothetical protein